MMVIFFRRHRASMIASCFVSNRAVAARRSAALSIGLVVRPRFKSSSGSHRHIVFPMRQLGHGEIGCTRLGVISCGSALSGRWSTGVSGNISAWAAGRPIVIGRGRHHR